MELRDYQKECVAAIDGMKSGSALVSMATGLGKTVVFSRIRRTGRVLIVSHREELVNQPLKYYDCPCGIEQGENVSHGEEVVSASVQSLIKRLDKFSPYDFDILITDEAHHAAAPSYKKIYSYFRPRIHVGFTATPNRGDKVRLDDVFEKIIFERDLKWGILKGYLSDVRCLRVNVSYDLRGVKRRMGDFVTGELDKAVNITSANRQIAEVYRKYARGQTLIFAASVAHAQNIAAEIEGAVVVSQQTKNRAEIISDFTERKIPCIVNCMIFTEGTDMPLIETVIIARPTQNPSLYTQMVGRGLRKAPDKKYLTLIDCVGVSGKLDICTAPTLMGLDIKDVPESRLKYLEGMLTEMPDTVEKACDCPENWVYNVEAVNLFAKEQGVNTRKINWTKKSNGDLVYQFTDGDRIGVKAMNELGKTRLMFYRYDEGEGKFVYSETEETSLQDALDKAYAYFYANYKDEEKLWNLSEYYGWQFEPATDKQKDYIKANVPADEWEALVKNRHLTKGDAAQILNALSLKNVTTKKLLAMHERKAAERKRQEEERKRLASLKIRYVLKKKGRSFKYYAVRCPDDLVIFDDWPAAEEFISSQPQNSVRYKGFTSKDAAIAFLRGVK
ncbi:MAG: viroplasmin family protein [Clostridia bacterium]|nr:viroplasmin family protein [Clostridia bacterium]